MAKKIELSDEDIKKINACDGYLSTKIITQSCVDYAELEVGTAVFIKYKDADDKFLYIAENRNGPPFKFLVIKNDSGFVFVKRILASGKISTDVVCLTTRWPSKVFSVEIDGEYIDSVLLDTEYDPMAQSKELARKKNKASRINLKKRISFSSAKDAYDFISNSKVGDILYSSLYSFGYGIATLRVKEIKKYPTKKALGHPVGSYYIYNTDAAHFEENFKISIELILECIDSDIPRYVPDRSLCFHHLLDIGKYKPNYRIFYKEKPIKASEIV